MWGCPAAPPAAVAAAATAAVEVGEGGPEVAAGLQRPAAHLPEAADGRLPAEAVEGRLPAGAAVGRLLVGLAG